jgi:hypothetical protein
VNVVVGSVLEWLMLENDSLRIWMQQADSSLLSIQPRLLGVRNGILQALEWGRALLFRKLHGQREYTGIQRASKIIQDVSGNQSDLRRQWLHGYHHHFHALLGDIGLQPHSDGIARPIQPQHFVESIEVLRSPSELSLMVKHSGNPYQRFRRVAVKVALALRSPIVLSLQLRKGNVSPTPSRLGSN